MRRPSRVLPAGGPMLFREGVEMRLTEDELRECIVGMYVKGRMSIASIARHTHKTYGEVDEILIVAGVEKRGRVPRGPRDPITAETRATIVAMRRQGMSYTSIKKATHRSYITVRRILLKEGIDGADDG